MSLEPPKREQEYWFPDGNIVLVASGVAFRVYQGLLKEHSEVFSSMFNVPQPSEGQAEEIEGIPVVHLSDRASDLRHLLRVLYPTRQNVFLSRDSRAGPTIESVAAVIRLAHKYEMQSLLEHGVRCLDWYTDSYETYFDDGADSAINPASLADAIFAVSVARLLNLPKLLVSALYTCCLAAPEDLILGVRCEDGGREKLSEDDLVACMKTTQVLSKVNALAATRAFEPMPLPLYDPMSTDKKPTCCNQRGVQECNSSLYSLLTRMAVSGFLATPRLSGWAAEIEKLQSKFPLCKVCFDEVKRREGVELRGVWNTLPRLFRVDVPQWNARRGGA